MKNNKSIAFLLPCIGHPRHEKRIKIIEECGASVMSYAFQRGDYPSDTDVNPSKIGSINHNEYFTRALKILYAAILIRGDVKNKDIIYAFGLDMLLLAVVASSGFKNKKIVYEVGDINHMMLDNKIVKTTSKILESILLKCVKTLVVTSPAYIKGYYEKKYCLNDIDVHVIENKIYEKETKKINQKSGVTRSTEKLIVGYFGRLRCKKAWIGIKTIAKQMENIKFVLAGVLKLEDMKKDIDSMENIVYNGTYNNPVDLPKMYKKIDLSWDAFLENNDFKKYQRTNRFYESCYYRTPMICQNGTLEGKIVSSLDIGTCLDLGNVEQYVNVIKNIGKKELKIWQNNIGELDKSVYVYSGEHKKLYDSI